MRSGRGLQPFLTRWRLNIPFHPCADLKTATGRNRRVGVFSLAGAEGVIARVGGEVLILKKKKEKVKKGGWIIHKGVEIPRSGE